MFYAAFIYIMAVISPGPNFILVSRYSALGSVRLGLAVTLGICTIGVCFSTLSLLGLASVIHVFPAFSKLSVILGAVYLIYIAFIIFRSTLRRHRGQGNGVNRVESIVSDGFIKAYKIGALTNVLNMKTIAFMISIYSGFLAVPRTPLEQVIIVIICSSLEFVWYFFVAVIFGRAVVRNIFLQYRISIDRGFSVFLTLFAIQNVYSII